MSRACCAKPASTHPKCSPKILPRGFLLQTDLGSRTYLSALDAASAPPLYSAAIDALILWQRATRSHALPPYDEALLARELDLFPDWYVARHLGIDADAIAAGNARRRLPGDPRQQSRAAARLRASRLPFAQPDGLGSQSRACSTSRTRSSARSPMTSSRCCATRTSTWDEARELDWAARYWERARRAGLPVGADFAAFWQDFEWMGVQRQLKVLGIFARLASSRRQDRLPRRHAARVCLPARRVRRAIASSRRWRRSSTRCTRGRRSRDTRPDMAISAMILAAGRGERMRPLSDACPKPLLEVGGKPLIVWQIEALARAGFRDIVVNVAHRAEQLVDALGDGAALRRRRCAGRWSPSLRDGRRHRHRAAAARPRTVSRRQRRHPHRFRLRVAAASRARDGERPGTATRAPRDGADLGASSRRAISSSTDGMLREARRRKARLRQYRAPRHGALR